MFRSLCKTIGIGLAVAAVWFVLCFIGGLFFFALRDIGIFALFFGIPIGGFVSWFRTRKYMLAEMNPYRGAVAFAARYFFVGAFFGFILAGCACDVAFTSFLGGFVGASVGALGGAVQGRLRPRTIKTSLHDLTANDALAETAKITEIFGQD